MSYVVVLLLRAVATGVAAEVNDVTVCDVVAESELTATDVVNDPVCAEVVETVPVLEMSEAVVVVVADPGLAMSTTWIVFVTVKVSTRRSVVGGEAT